MNLKKISYVFVALVLGLTASCNTRDITNGSSAASISSAKEITAFSIEDQTGIFSGPNISVTMPYGTDITSLTPTITHTGVSISPKVGAAQNFKRPVLYTVTAENGSTQSYIVDVRVATVDSKEITAFSLVGQIGVISGTNISVTLPYVPYGRPLKLIPTISHTGVSITPDRGIEQDFTHPVPYTVTAQDGSTQTYLVTVTVVGENSKEITAFSLAGQTGVISGPNIYVTLPYGTDVTSLTPTITRTGVSISPDLGVAQDFTHPVLYNVTAQNGSSQSYSVVVTVADIDSKEITAFSFWEFQGFPGVILGTNIFVALPVGTKFDTFSGPIINYTGVSVVRTSSYASPYTSVVTLGVPIIQTYRVTAGNGTTQDYTVTIGAQQIEIGSSYQGGKVAYILQPGDLGYVAGEVHGLIASVTDQGGYYEWVSWSGNDYTACPYITTGATGTAIGTGSYNTDTTILVQGPITNNCEWGGPYAAQVAREYRGGGYSDWYLPSKDELNQLYLNRYAIGGFDCDHGVYYLSSSEPTLGDTFLNLECNSDCHTELDYVFVPHVIIPGYPEMAAWGQSFYSSGDPQPYYASGVQSLVFKETTWPIRPVRSF